MTELFSDIRGSKASGSDRLISEERVRGRREGRGADLTSRESERLARQKKA